MFFEGIYMFWQHILVDGVSQEYLSGNYCQINITVSQVDLQTHIKFKHNGRYCVFITNWST